MVAIRTLVLIVAAAIGCVGAEAGATDLKAVLKASYAEMLKENDLWSAIQVEAIAAAQKIDLRGAPCLAGSDIHGDPTFACPDEVRVINDRGDAICAATSQRLHCFANDGRPLAPSVPYGIRGDAVDIAFDGGAVGVVTFYDNEKQLPDRWRARTVGCPSGNILLESDDEDLAESTIDNVAKTANDGSAIAFSLHRHGGDRHVIVATAKGKRSLPGLFRTRGVGPQASWLLVEDGGENNQLLLLIDRRIRLRSSAVGPGLVAGITDEGKPIVVDKLGKVEPLVLPIGLGNAPTMATVGRWLVVSSGDGARSLDNTNLLGEPMGEAPFQRNTMALFRWDDLVGDIHARALYTYENQLQIAQAQCAALYLWHDKQADLLDLSTRQPVVKTIGRFPKIVDWVDGRRSATLVSVRDTGMVMLDAQNQEVATDPTFVDFIVLHKSWAIAKHGNPGGRSYFLVKLASDPTQRSVQQLKLTADEWTFRLDGRRNRLCADGDRKWIEFDLAGDEIARGNPINRPSYESPSWQAVGRFCNLGGRVLPKATYDDLSDWQRLVPRDAWQVGRSLMVLARDERVLVSGKKKNEFVELGSCAGADRIALRKDDIVIVNGPGRVIAGLANGQLLLDPTARLDPDPPSGGPWRIEGMQFSPPRGGTLEWDDRCGFQPLRLRSPRNNDPQGMLLVTQSLVINLDPGVAKLVGKKR